MKNIAIFASGEGSNAEAIAKYFANSDIARVKAVLSNREDAGVHTRMASLGIKTVTFSRREWDECQRILYTLKEESIDFIALAGFLCCIGSPIIEVFEGKIINIHPSLLPKFGGKGMWGKHVHEAVIAAKEKESGITIHYVTKEIDGGTIIFQAKCPASADDTAETLANRVHELEYRHYPEVIEKLLK